MKKEIISGWSCEAGYGYSSASIGKTSVQYDGKDFRTEEIYNGYLGASGSVYVPATVIKWLIDNWEEFKI